MNFNALVTDLETQRRQSALLELFNFKVTQVRDVHPP